MNRKLKRKPRPIPYWWMSFADEIHDVFNGVVIMRARDMQEALTIAHKLGISPGGQVVGFRCLSDFHIPEEAVGKLLDRETLNRLFPDDEVKSIKEHRLEGYDTFPCC